MADVYTNSYKTPTWLNEEFMQSALREGLRRDSLNVSSCKVLPATNVGDNYLSQMFRCSTHIQSRRKGSEQMSVLVKSMPKGELAQAFVNESAFFSRETQMLSETLPELNRIATSIGRSRLCAHLYFKQDQPEQMLVIEDLCQAGFRSANRLECLDLPHTFVVVRSLADFHAASLVAVKKNPNLKDTYFSSYWAKEFENRVSKFVLDGLRTLEKCIQDWGIFPDFLKTLDRLKSTAVDKLYASTERIDTELNVLNHGDPWTSNMLFKYENGQPIDLRLVDFQLSCYNSPTFDLLYFIFTSVKNEYRVSKLDEILKCYHDRLTENCEKLNYPLNFSFDTLKKTFYDRIYFGFFLTCSLLPFMIVPSKDVKDLNDTLDVTKALVHDVSSNLNYREAAETVIPFFMKLGILD